MKHAQAYETLYDIRHEGLQALKGLRAVKRERAKRNLRQLDKMPRQLQVLDIFSEAVVAHSVLCESRPARANARLERLRVSCAKRGRMDQYHAFEAKVSACLGETSLSGHGFMQRSLADADKSKIYKGVQELIAMLGNMGLPAFANSGTLLGLTREGGLLEHDDDIDLAVMLDTTTDNGAASAFNDLFAKLKGQGLECRYLAGGNAIIKLPSIDGFEVDLFPAYGTHRKYSIYPYARRSVTRSDVWPLKPCPKTGIAMPSKPEVLLEANYGTGWQVPNPRFTFPWAAQKRKFAPFLKEVKADV